jgi:predicted ArsR family transcriptional regulator
LPAVGDLRNVFVVKSSAGSSAAALTGDRTRERVTAYLLAHGTATAGQVGAALGLGPAAIRKHLDALLAEGTVSAREQRHPGSRGRGRPARGFALTETGRARCGGHTYDNLAHAALRWIARDGDAAVAAFAADLAGTLESRCQAATAHAGDDPLARAEALASVLSAEGYAASASVINSGGQLCQHHCPVAQAAAEFPQLCEAETQVISRLVGTHVQRLATIAHGDGVCTTHIPDPRRSIRHDSERAHS